MVIIYCVWCQIIEDYVWCQCGHMYGANGVIINVVICRDSYKQRTKISSGVWGGGGGDPMFGGGYPRAPPS